MPISAPFARRIAYMLDAQAKAEADGLSTSGQHIIREAAEGNCHTAVDVLFGFPVERLPLGNLAPNWGGAMDKHTELVAGATYYASYEDFSNALRKIQKTPLIIQVEAFHSMAFLGFDESGEGAVFQKTNLGIHNPWEVISLREVFSRYGRYEMSLRAPRDVGHPVDRASRDG